MLDGEDRYRAQSPQVYQKKRWYLSVGMNARRLRLPPTHCRSGGRRLRPRARARSECPRRSAAPRESRRRRRRPRRWCRSPRSSARFDAPAPYSPSRLGAGRAALDDDQRIMRRKPRALGFGIGRAGENRRFLLVGEQDCRASRPREEIVGADLAQEFRRRRIDADGLISRAPHDIENRRARGRGKE